MSIAFTPAKRENVGLLIGLAGGTGSGKTFSAMRLASGIAGSKPFAVIDTEAGRAKHYADQFRFDHAELLPPFRPGAYAEAIKAADDARYPVIVVDSMSHEWTGDGGVTDWQEEILEDMVRRALDRNDSRHEWQVREASKMRAWIEPKVAHKRMVQKLLQVRAHLILCFRAEPKVDMVKENGKTVIVEKKGLTGINGWFPICEKHLPFELTTSFLLAAEKPGIPLPIKLQQQHRDIFPADQPITEESGKRIAAWASGVAVASPAGPSPAAKPATPDSPSLAVAKRWQALHPKPASQTAKAYSDQFYFFVKSRIGQDIKSASELTEDSIVKLSIVLDEIEASRQTVTA